MIFVRLKKNPNLSINLNNTKNNDHHESEKHDGRVAIPSYRVNKVSRFSDSFSGETLVNKIPLNKGINI
jgi:hypothetical protein